MTDWEQNLQDELREVRQVYVKALEERLKQLENTVTEYRDSPADIENRNNLITIVHRLRGSAGSFGFNAISTAAEELEEWLEENANAPFDNADHTDMFDKMLGCLISEIKDPKLEI